MNFQQVLEQCADRLEKAAFVLNGASYNCRCCGLRVFEDKKQAEMKEQLESFADRMRKFAVSPFAPKSAAEEPQSHA